MSRVEKPDIVVVGVTKNRMTMLIKKDKIGADLALDLKVVERV